MDLAEICNRSFAPLTRSKGVASNVPEWFQSIVESPNRITDEIPPVLVQVGGASMSSSHSESPTGVIIRPHGWQCLEAPKLADTGLFRPDVMPVARSCRCIVVVTVQITVVGSNVTDFSAAHGSPGASNGEHHMAHLRHTFHVRIGSPCRLWLLGIRVSRCFGDLTQRAPSRFSARACSGPQPTPLQCAKALATFHGKRNPLVS